ncbi:Metallo-hydrolase/oxidoreductase [Neocallimastix californiae]|jgi:L-ascorbate metabolism protein UlaG (beta-lactamase superfamily)|uniref:Metallo-hydrolase/oxidoreductase n=1 Tax=Neocallimastix californiae TaxID=1754190 RepID=A0A1Y2AWM8_9FUNG|nr:Metallo-hydrolase/oxidoreductase [Neocallimastix californiae]|eukprot:ORY26647.1 Metallo-hydrolase/oxidoreductase [Neocallimastix californiae]
MINYIEKLPERQKNPETCASVKQGKKYINPWPSVTRREASKEYGVPRIIKGYMKNYFSGNEKHENLKVDLNLKVITDYHENDGNIAMQLFWLGHAAFLLQINSFTILFDPFLSRRASPIGFIGPYRCKDKGFKSFSELPPIDFVIISHSHYDHLDKKTIKEIFAEKQNKNRTHIFCPKDLKKWFLSINIPDNQVTECDWWDDHKITQLPDTIDIKDENKLNEALASPTSRKIIIGAVPCQHFSGRSGFDNNETLWAGWVVKSSDASYYFAGDTGYRSLPDNCPEEEIENYPVCPVFKQIGTIHGPFDLASIPISPALPPHMMSPIHSNPRDGVDIHIDCKSKHSIAMHWGTVLFNALNPIESGPARLREELDKKNIPHEQFHDTYIGEMIQVEKKS